MNELSENEKQSLKFLECDFNQCFQQLRHYDGQIFEIFKFTFTAYTALIGITIGFYEFGMQHSKDFSRPIIASIGVGLVLGIYMFALVVRNRLYFVRLVRYINEQRELFFQFKPLGFSNKAKMYTNPKFPLAFNFFSSQSFFLYIVATLNSVLFGIGLFLVINPGHRKCTILLLCPILILLQIGIGATYLKSADKK